MNKCRIINGVFKRRLIKLPAISSTRPTSNIVKESIFNVLFHRFYIDFSKSFVIDFFAGSGALGIEAISCGCQNVLFIDINAIAVRCIKDNIRDLKIKNFARIRCKKVELIRDNVIWQDSENYESIVVFMDPPYKEKELLLNQVSRLKSLFQNKVLTLIIESDEYVNLEDFDNFHKMKHGNTLITIASKSTQI
ncbi:MAG: RsmD family RNA methyltransferase [Holosporales bacterium]|jgi:16S rRNA (guanine(966)-N(2))-methyltransferase RsmD|nr:RsmD family RNA methyltransferase [Holosporales bacterium]